MSEASPDLHVNIGLKLLTGMSQELEIRAVMIGEEVIKVHARDSIGNKDVVTTAEQDDEMKVLVKQQFVSVELEREKLLLLSQDKVRDLVLTLENFKGHREAFTLQAYLNAFLESLVSNG